MDTPEAKYRVACMAGVRRREMGERGSKAGKIFSFHGGFLPRRDATPTVARDSRALAGKIIYPHQFFDGRAAMRGVADDNGHLPDESA